MSFWDLLGTVGGLAGGYALSEQIGKTGDQAASDMGQLAGQLQQDTAFTGYGVTTPFGRSSVDSTGSTNVGVGREAALTSATGKYHHGNLQMQNAYQMLQEGAQNPYASQAADMMGAGYGQMQGAFDDTAQREQDIYNRAMAMQQPGLDAARAQSNAQEYAAGRGGVMGSQFGGTGEDAAMARAQAQAQNAAAFQAMGQAQQEAMNQAAVGQQMFGAGAGYNQAGLSNAQLGQAAAGTLGGLGAQQAGLGLNAYQTSFMPFQQQLAAMGMAQNNAAMAQGGQLAGAGYGAQLGLGGIQAQINAQKAASELYGNLFGAMMSNSEEIGEAGGSLFDFIKSKF